MFHRALGGYVTMREQMLADATDGDRGLDDLLALEHAHRLVLPLGGQAERAHRRAAQLGVGEIESARD